MEESVFHHPPLRGLSFTYPPPPEFPFLPGLAALLNPLKCDAPKKSSPSSSQSSSTGSPSSHIRTLRCKTCMGCQSPACGKCDFCKDSVQFGGPGIKKQSCVQRKCVLLLENRIQKETNGIKLRTACKKCAGCEQPDCQHCLVCLDKKFLDGKYLTGAICSKKKCVATAAEITFEDLQKEQRKHRKTKPCKKVLKVKIPKKVELPKPKRAYTRRPRKPSPVLIFDEKPSQIESVKIEGDGQPKIQSRQVSQDSPVLQPQILGMDPPPSLFSPSKLIQDSEISKIRRFRPPESVIPFLQSQMSDQIPFLPKKNQFQKLENARKIGGDFNPNSFMSNFQDPSFQQHQQQGQPLNLSNQPQQPNPGRRVLYRRYLRISSNFDFNPSDKFDPFIPPSYSGNGEVILQAL